MTVLTIRNVEDSLIVALRVTAEKYGISMEDQAKIILHNALVVNKNIKGLGSKIHQYFADIGCIELELPKHSPPRPAPSE